MRRSGFTLLELMLVMAVILVAGAIAVPAIDSMMSDGKAKAASDMVRARWAEIRGRAMREGRPYKFSVTYQSGKWRIEPENPADPSETGEDQNFYKEGELPQGVLFAKDQGTIGEASKGGGDYETLAVYLPDGTARDDVQIMFGQSGSQAIGLKLRALTGAVSSFDPARDAKDGAK